MGEAKRAGRVASHQALPIRSFSGAASSSAALTETTSVRPCGRDVDGKCRSVATRRYASLDQLFIRIEKIVTGRLNIVDISEFEWLRERNGRAGCADGHRLPSIRWKTHACGERTKAAGTKIRLQIIGQKILAHLSPEAGGLRVHWLATTSSEPCHRS
jgi:hypothetical protein